jgi:gamma-glutamyltranspeptidase
MTIDRAVDAPRVHHCFLPDEFRFERQRPIAKAIRQQLLALGHKVSPKQIPIGDANSILLVDGIAWGYADPREGGLALPAIPSERTR